LDHSADGLIDSNHNAPQQNKKLASFEHFSLVDAVTGLFIEVQPFLHFSQGELRHYGYGNTGKPLDLFFSFTLAQTTGSRMLSTNS